MLNILVLKAGNHQNVTVIRSCVKGLIKNSISMVSFPELFYEVLMKILNNPIFYSDCTLEKDSKFSEYLLSYFQKQYSNLD
jgi:hypothetical protein